METYTPQNSTGLYRIWKIEKQIWLKGLSAMEGHFLTDALIIPPHPFPPQRFKGLLEASKKARPFIEVEMKEKQFISLGNTVIITYFASAKHERFRRFYRAQCMTTYVRVEDVFKVAGHTHLRVTKK